MRRIPENRMSVIEAEVLPTVGSRMSHAGGPGVERLSFRELIGELMQKIAAFLTKLFIGVVLFCLSVCFVWEKATGKAVPMSAILSIFPDSKIAEASYEPSEQKLSPEDIKDTTQALALIQANVGQKISLPKTPTYTQDELIQLIGDTVDEECRKTTKCVPGIVLQGIAKKENYQNNLNPNAIVLEKSLVDKKFKPFADEGALSNALSPFSFGMMQVNWGYSKEICHDMLIEEGGDPQSLYLKLLDPRINVRCSLLVFLEKWSMAKAKKLTGAGCLVEAVRLYNGTGAPVQYASDVMGHVKELLAKGVRG